MASRLGSGGQKQHAHRARERISLQDTKPPKSSEREVGGHLDNGEQLLLQYLGTAVPVLFGNADAQGAVVNVAA